MSQSRGKGKVVPRSSKLSSLNVQQPQLLASSSPATVAVQPSHSQAHLPPSQAPGGSLVPAAKSDSSNSHWRCADCVVANSRPVQQLPASKLSSGSGRRLLSSGQPLLLKHLQLPRCSLRQQQKPAPTTPAAQPADASPQPGQIAVLCSPASSNRFMTADATKNMPGSYYHVRKPETSVLQMPFSSWLDCWQGWTSNRLLLQAHVCNWELHDTPTRLRLWPNKAVYPHLHHLLDIAPQLPATHQPTSLSNSHITTTNSSSSSSSSTTIQQPHQTATQHMLDWALLQELLQAGNWAATGSLHLLAGGSDALLPARYETHDRLINQVAGRQQVLLLPPDLAFRGLYPYPVHHPYDRLSAVDWEDPELEHWPAAAQVRGLVCELAPGDTLLVPAYWFLHTQLLQPACVSLELQLTARPERLVSPPALLLQLSRMMELWFGAEAGPPNVRKWFKALSEGREWQLLEPQLLTPKGCRLLQCCHMAMEQLQRVLALQQLHADSSTSSTGIPSAGRPETQQGATTGGQQQPEAWEAGDLESAARLAVGLMCDGRLVPTTWLNEGITDALYLQHPPTYHLVEEDEEAARYSSLFRHRLIANRADWMDHATPLQLAPPGSKRTLMVAGRPAHAALPPTA